MQNKWQEIVSFAISPFPLNSKSEQFICTNTLVHEGFQCSKVDCCLLLGLCKYLVRDYLMIGNNSSDKNSKVKMWNSFFKNTSMVLYRMPVQRSTSLKSALLILELGTLLLKNYKDLIAVWQFVENLRFSMKS